MRHTEIYSIFTNDFEKIFDFYVQPNPEEILQEAIESVESIFNNLNEHYGVEYEDFRIYLKMVHPLIDQKIDRLWDELDTDVFDHYAHGTLLSFELKSWKKALRAWKETIMQAAKEFVKDAFHEHYDPSVQQPQLAAA